MIVSLNIPVHIWILYTFLLNGFVVSHILCIRSSTYTELLKTGEARILSSFFISIVINGTALLLCSKIGCNFDYLRFFLPIVSVLLLVLLWRELVKKKKKVILSLPDFSWGRLLLYSFVFTILLINGGLIERLADSWWHLSLANKIAFFGSFDQDQVAQHLNGVTGRYYPPLWHGNLAMLHKISGISLPVLWNTFTPWGGVFKVMGFYLLSLGVSNNKGIAFLSAILFVLLPGLGDSYLRVSAWPSHIAYTAWFCMFYITFIFFDKCKLPVIVPKNDKLPGFIMSGFGFVRQNRMLIMTFVVLAAVVFFSHQAELLWFALAMLFYAMMLVGCNLFAGFQSKCVEPGVGFLRVYLVGGVSCVLYLTFQRYHSVVLRTQEFSDVHVISLLLIGIAASFLYLVTEKSLLKCLYKRNVAKVMFGVVLVLLLLSIDMRQLCSLFNAELSYPRPNFPGASTYCTGWLGGQLMLPDWNMQLRPGLLYSGVLAVAISVVMVFIEPKRCTIFLAANSVIPFLFLVSPYLYQWLMDTLQYMASWRVALLIFHPIVLACCMNHLWHMAISRIYEQ